MKVYPICRDCKHHKKVKLGFFKNSEDICGRRGGPVESTSINIVTGEKTVTVHSRDTTCENERSWGYPYENLCKPEAKYFEPKRKD